MNAKSYIFFFLPTAEPYNDKERLEVMCEIVRVSLETNIGDKE